MRKNPDKGEVVSLRVPRELKSRIEGLARPRPVFIISDVLRRALELGLKMIEDEAQKQESPIAQ